MSTAFPQRPWRVGQIGYLGGTTEVQVVGADRSRLVVEVLEDVGVMREGERYSVARETMKRGRAADGKKASARKGSGP